MCASPQLKKRMQDEIEELGRQKKLSSLEKPKEFHVHWDLFSTDNGLLTSTFKLKRNVAQQVFKAEIDEMYVAAEAAERARATRA